MAWSELAREFRVDGFYERFPAKGQVERVARITPGAGQGRRAGEGRSGEGEGVGLTAARVSRRSSS
jgi:hypothetical protein